MKQRIIYIFATLFISALSLTKVYSQADTLVQVCSQHMIPPYISDGQQYQTILNEDEIAEFHASFFGGSTYRLVGCSGLNERNLVFTVYDRDKNILFTNATQENAPYWDLKFNSTMDCTIEAKIDNKLTSSGFAIMLIGFKQ